MVCPQYNWWQLYEIQRTSACERGVETIQKSTIIHIYNTYMGGVDKDNQLVTYYGFPHFSKKWWKRIFFHMVDTTLVNAYIMYIESTPAHCLSHMDFQLDVARPLINEQSNICSVHATPQDVPLRLSGRHFPVPSIKKDCKVYSRRKSGKRKRKGQRKTTSKELVSYKATVCM